MATASLVLTAGHPDFPIGVKAMVRPPETLYLRGRLPPGRSIGIVGTRNASAPALHFARMLATEACRAGWVVYSGGAAGIDTAAHEGALEGLSAYPEEQRGTRWTFLPRNELLAALVDDLVVVQAPVRSGARSTMAAARRMGKNLWAVPASPWEKSGQGCLAEIQMGARVLSNTSQIFGRAGARTHSQALSKPERAVVEVLKKTPASLDMICETSGLAFSEAAATVLTLTLKRVLLESADGSYHLNQ